MSDTTIAVLTEHSAAGAAIREHAAFPMRKLSIVGQGYPTEEKVIGFDGTADRVRFRGRQGAFWRTALYSVGVPRDSVLACKAAVKADGLLVMAHGTEEGIVRAHAIPGTADAREVAVHSGVIALAAEPAVA